jgi:hypothetical protein
MEQVLGRLDADIPATVPKLSKHRSSQRDLSQRRQSRMSFRSANYQRPLIFAKVSRYRRDAIMYNRAGFRCMPSAAAIASRNTPRSEAGNRYRGDG